MIHTILIVDDAAENIDILVGILGDEYNIKAATNGLTALKIAEKVTPDIILLDIMMPDMDGYEVCERLKNNPITSSIPVIFITAMDQEMDEAKGFEVGAVDYVTKPVSPLIVKARLRTQLALKDQNAELERQVTLKTKEISETRMEIIKRLGIASEYRDCETGLHIERVSKITYFIAKAYGFEERHAQILMSVAPMHDIGKIGVPEEILLKPGKLTPEEFDIVKTHCEIGAQIIGEHNEELLRAAKIVALQHHEKWNGTGYPNELSGKDIHIYARIVAIADVFDALISRRPYKDAWSFEDAFQLVKSESGKHFDPFIVNAFINAIDEISEVIIKYGDDEHRAYGLSRLKGEIIL